MIGVFVALASAQTIDNGGLSASAVPVAVPNEVPIDVPGWDLDDPSGLAGSADVATANPARSRGSASSPDLASQRSAFRPLAPRDASTASTPVHCADLLVDSPDGGTFVHAEATNVPGAPQEELRQRISTEVEGLEPGRPYRVRFEASIVRHYGQSSGYWRVGLGSSAVDTDLLVLPPNPGVQIWRTLTTGDLVADAETTSLWFEAVSYGGGDTLSPLLPAAACPYASAPDTTELLLDGIVLLLDEDGDELFGDDDPCPLVSESAPQDHDGDGLSDDDELAYGTDPCDPDTDADGLSDGDERYRAELGNGACPDPRQPDSDADGILDGAEVFPAPGRVDEITPCWDDASETTTTPVEVGALPTDPCDADSDDDGIDDDAELGGGTDPARPDTDGDGIDDGDDELPLDCTNGEDPPKVFSSFLTSGRCGCATGDPPSVVFFGVGALLAVRRRQSSVTRRARRAT